MSTARKRGAGTSAEVLREVKRQAREGLERELARGIREDGRGTKTGKKFRPVKLKRRQGSANALTRGISHAEFFAVFADIAFAGLKRYMTNIEVPK